MSQLALPLQLADHAVFASFFARGNETLVATLSAIASGNDSNPDGYGCWLWGPQASGKTHLLQAVCGTAGDRAAYVPLSMLAPAGPGILDGLANRELICIDDVDRVAGRADWESALFDLYNQVQDAAAELVVSAAAAPRECAFQLEDLKSRFARLPVFQIHVLDDEERITALQLRSQHRGLELPDDTARYLLNRSRRDMASLYDLLDTLDKEALRAKRRLTIPFVRSVIGDRTTSR
jgi:DnaA family protein